MTAMKEPQDREAVLDFWFPEGRALDVDAAEHHAHWRWRMQGGADDQIIARFSDLTEKAARGALDHWVQDPHGQLALIILLDQFSRNMFRKDARAFAQDERARGFARLALERGHDVIFPPAARQFFYLPFMHSEDIDDQSLCVDLFRQLGNQNNYFYALVHMDAIRRFGRFPHRNAVLGRTSSKAEEAYMATGGFSA